MWHRLDVIRSCFFSRKVDLKVQEYSNTVWEKWDLSKARRCTSPGDRKVEGDLGSEQLGEGRLLLS